MKKFLFSVKYFTSVILFAGMVITFPAITSQARAALTNQSQTYKNPSEKISPDLQSRLLSLGNEDPVTVILQLNSSPTGRLNALLQSNGIRVKGRFENFGSMAVELPAGVVAELADFDEVEFLTPDAPVESFGHVTSTTGAEMVRAQTTATGTSYTLDGTGIGIAILDSGMYLEHKAFKDAKGTSRIVYSQDFTGENQKGDPYGHGTHVAAAAAGLGSPWKGKYTGIAPNAKIINLRVLNSLGQGETSNLINALNWIYNNRTNTTYNIKVVNLSLGTAAINSYTNDPLCQAVRKLVDAGIVVVAAAGNNGKDASGQKTYGNIHSPGNEPSAITVGSANTFGTDSRGDDTVTTYSSRGPTRSYSTGSNGTKRYDNLIKPDLVAPGNKIVYAQSYNNQLVVQHPELNTGFYPTSNMNQMYLNGTSVAAPVVAGAAALLLQANPKLTPNLVKTILMYSAQQLKGYNTFEQGAGELNLEGAIRLAKLVRTDLSNSTALGTSLLTTTTAPVAQSTVGGTTFPWSQGIVLDYTYAKGTDLITKYQNIYRLGVLLGDGTTLTNGVLMSDKSLFSSGVLLGDNIMTSNGVLMSDGTVFCANGVLISDGVLMSDGVLFGDGVLMSDGVLISDGVLMSDYSTIAQTALIYGDNTTAMY